MIARGASPTVVAGDWGHAVDFVHWLFQAKQTVGARLGFFRIRIPLAETAIESRHRSRLRLLAMLTVTASNLSIRSLTEITVATRPR
jgi:hypothetical protein